MKYALPGPEALPPLRLLSVVIPARDEEGCIASTVQHLHLELSLKGVPHEIVVVDDGSQDRTWEILQELQPSLPELRPVRNGGSHGFGRAVVGGFESMSGDAVIVMMADASDDARDAVTYWEKLNEGYHCVFGSRFVKGGGVIDYPRLKLVMNRIVNTLIRWFFRIPLNDTTNAFKAYRRSVIDGCRPLISPHFNLTVELPLKAIVRGYSWAIVPITWRNRREGAPKLKLKEMGSRYFFICAYLWLEKYFSRGDYRRQIESHPVAGMAGGAVPADGPNTHPAEELQRTQTGQAVVRRDSSDSCLRIADTVGDSVVNQDGGAGVGKEP